MLVATPIGNVADLSPRAAHLLAQADVVCCEDTRHSGQLFARLGIRPQRLMSLHEHNESARGREIVGLIEAGLTVALVSDAGMPVISDPGARLVTLVHEAGLRVTAVPGPSAAVTAVALAGFGGDRFSFEGFVPKKGAERAARLAEIAASPVPSVIYEAPGRVEALLSDLARLCGDERAVTVGRELTKLHEEVWRGGIGEAVRKWPSEEARGEFVIVLEGATEPQSVVPSPLELAEAVSRLTAAGSTRRDAVAEVAERSGISRRAVYDAVGPAQREKKDRQDGL